MFSQVGHGTSGGYKMSKSKSNVNQMAINFSDLIRLDEIRAAMKKDPLSRNHEDYRKVIHGCVFMVLWSDENEAERICEWFDAVYEDSSHVEGLTDIQQLDLYIKEKYPEEPVDLAVS